MNPELRRNLWLEISTHRLVAMPVVLALLFIVVASLAHERAAQALAWLGLAGFGVITALWGMRLAANAVFDELIEKTWDWQRLSSLRPWSMTWAKLCGATVYAWYGGLICLAVFVWCARDAGYAFPWRGAASLILVAIALHAATLASALVNARRTGGTAPSRRSVTLLILFTWIYGGGFLLPRLEGRLADVLWYGKAFPMSSFALASVAVFAGWALLGAYRSMCQSLAVATTPWAIASFMAFLALYSAGFLLGRVIPEDLSLQAICFSGLAWSAVITYLLMFTEPSGPIVIRRIVRKLHQRAWKRVFEELPCWPVAWSFLTLCALGLSLFPLGTFPSFAGRWAFAPLALALLVARDGAILVFFSAAPQPRRAAATTLIYILVLDWLLPSLLTAMGLPQLSRLVLPLSHAGESQVLPTLIALAQASLACWLALRRVRLRA